MKKQFKLVKDRNSFQIHWEKKSINEKVDNDWNKYLEIEWYASTKDKDRGHDIVEPKAFENALATYMTNPVVLLQHKHDKPIGVVTEANIDNKWLYIKANITENTDNVMSAIKNWVLRTFSIGYWLKEWDYEVEESVDENWNYDYTTTIKNLELYEISVVSVPMNAYALMKSIEDCFEVKEVEDEEIEWTCIDWEVNIEHGEEEIDEDLQENVDEEWGEKSNEEEIDSDDDTIDNEENEETLSWNVEIQKSEEETPIDTEDENEDSDGKNEEWINNNEEEKVETTENVEQETKENQEEVEEPKIDETTEVEEATENEVETPTNDEVVDETSNDEVVEAKSMEEVESKSFQIDEKAIEERLEKKFETKFVEQTKKVEDLEKKLEQTKEVLKLAVDVLKEMDWAVRNTVIKTGARYSQVAKRKSAWWEVINKAQSAL